MSDFGDYDDDYDYDGYYKYNKGYDYYEDEHDDYHENYYNYRNENNYLGKKFNRSYSSDDESENFNNYNYYNKFSEEFNEDDEYYDFEDEDEDFEDDSYEFNCETGNIGEKLVYDEIKGIKNLGKIKWMNQKGESFEPYDFKIINGNKIIYIDAKSTVFEKGDDPFPIISENEQEFIINLKNNEKYYIARVFDARGENPTITYYDVKTMEKIPKYKIGI